MNRRGVLIGGGAAAAVIAGGGLAAGFSGMGSSADYEGAMAVQRAPLSPGADVQDIVRYATLAPSGHNTQPWRFRVSDGSIAIVPDLTRRTPVVDPDDHHLYASLGCAAENLSLAAGSRGLLGEPRFDPQGKGEVVFDYATGAAQPSVLVDAIPRRQSTRAEYDGRAATSSDLMALERAAATPGVDVAIITERAQIDRVRDMILAGNGVQMADRAFMAELKAWLRFNPRAALRHGDGLYAASSGNPVLPDWLGPTMFDLAFKVDAENEKYVRHMNSSAGVAVFTGEEADAAHWFSVGRACQRFALQATALGMKLAFVNQPVEVADLRPDLAALVGLPGRRPDIVMRFGYGSEVPMSPRRPVEAVIDA